MVKTKLEFWRKYNAIFVNPRTYKGVGWGEGWMPPLKVFLRFFQTHLLLVHAVFSSCSFIPETHTFW